MRVVSIDSISAKLDKLLALEASLMKRLNDVRVQIEEVKTKKNELIAQKITSQVKDLNEEMLQEILLEYAKRNNTSNAVTEKNAEAPSAKQKQEAPKESKVAKADDAANSTPSGTDAHNETVSSESNSDENNDEGENADEIKPFKMDQSPWDN